MALGTIFLFLLMAGEALLLFAPDETESESLSGAFDNSERSICSVLKGNSSNYPMDNLPDG